MEYTYEGLVRYSFGFANPNHAAALFSILIPIMWGLRKILKGKLAFASILIVEILLYLALISTISRTGIAAVILGGAFFFYLTHKHWGRRLDGRSVMLTVLIVAGACMILFAFGMLKRHFSWIGTPDDSILNRFILWQGGLQMLADNPSGIGTGLSGMVFTDFMQLEGSKLAFRTMVNSFLTFMVEQGILLSFLAAVPLFFAFISSFISLRREMPEKRKFLAISLMASCLCAVLSGMSSTCFDLSVILGIPGSHDLNSFLQLLLSAVAAAFFAILVWLPLGYIRPLEMNIGLLASLAASAATVSAALLAGSMIDSRERTSFVVSEEDGLKMLTMSPKMKHDGRMLVLAGGRNSDRKNIAGFIKNKYGGFSLDFPISAPKSTEKLFKAYDYVVLCGGNAAFAGPDEKTKFIFYNPTSFVQIDSAKVEKVYLDKFDEYGCARQWEKLLAGEMEKIQYLF